MGNLCCKKQEEVNVPLLAEHKNKMGKITRIKRKKKRPYYSVRVNKTHRKFRTKEAAQKYLEDYHERNLNDYTV
jgi:hypothetical protein